MAEILQIRIESLLINILDTEIFISYTQKRPIHMEFKNNISLFEFIKKTIAVEKYLSYSYQNFDLVVIFSDMETEELFIKDNVDFLFKEQSEKQEINFLFQPSLKSIAFFFSDLEISKRTEKNEILFRVNQEIKNVIFQNDHFFTNKK
jgi:hypothetical protein